MHTLLIDRANWCWEVGLSERTYWDCDNVLAAFNSIVNGRAASRAEVKRNSCAGISDAHECRSRPFDLCALPGKAGLDAKDATCSTLARQAMADGDPDRVYGGHHGELPTTTRCCPNRHSAPAGNCDASHCGERRATEAISEDSRAFAAGPFHLESGGPRERILAVIVALFSRPLIDESPSVTEALLTRRARRRTRRSSAGTRPAPSREGGGPRYFGRRR